MTQKEVFSDRPTKIIEKKYFNQHRQDDDFAHHFFIDTGAVKLSFTNVNFSFCIFKNGYFKNCKFVDCNFTGAQFENSNFRSSTFVNCKFIFSVFRGTEVSHLELLSNLSEWPNNNREWLRRLRLNAESIGDVKAVKACVKEEMLASREHLKKAREAKEGYYAKTYKGWDKRLPVYIESIGNFFDWHIWGHGEYPHKLAGTIVLIISLSSAYLFLQGQGVNGNAQWNDLLLHAWHCLRDVSQTFIGVKVESVGDGLASSLSLVRYVSLGLFTSVLYKSIARR
jgi:hypothetical protein